MKYIAIIVISIVGTSLHFLYNLSHHNKFVAVFAAVNESTWEHIKICMTPTLLWSAYDYYLYGINPNYLIAKSLSLLTIIIVIPVLFYSYTAFTKKAILPVDVVCFYITVTCSQLVFYHFINTKALDPIHTYLCTLLLIIEITAYLTLTYFPLKNFIFKDPITKKYGLEGHPETHHHHH